MKKLPGWIFDKLGCMVTLKKAHDDGIVSWPVGTMLLLNSIQCGFGKPYVTLSPITDLSLEENFSPDDIEPYTSDRRKYFSLK